MKKLMWINIVVAVLLPVIFFGFQLFAYGGCPIPIWTTMIATLLMWSQMILTLTALLLFVINLISIIRLWGRYKFRSLMPLGILAVGIVITSNLSGIGIEISKNRFQKYLPQYEEVVAIIKSDAINMNGGIRLPQKYKHLACRVLAYGDEQNALTVEFLVGGIGPPPKHTVYLYSSNGIIKEGSRADKRWYSKTRVNEHWFRVSD